MAVDIARYNFNLNRDTQLKDITIQGQRANKAFTIGGEVYKQEQAGIRQQAISGIRDIRQNQADAVKSVVNNALQRGIFNSGIRREETSKVHREAGEAISDLRGNTNRALEILKQNRLGAHNDLMATRATLANQQNYWKNLKFNPGGGGGISINGPDFGFLQTFMDQILALLNPGVQGPPPPVNPVRPGSNTTIVRPPGGAAS